jgi:hypothetical protein
VPSSTVSAPASAKAGAANYITVSEDEDAVRLVGPPRKRPRRYWTGSAWQLLELLAVLSDDAGVQAAWRALSRGAPDRHPRAANNTVCP